MPSRVCGAATPVFSYAPPIRFVDGGTLLPCHRGVGVVRVADRSAHYMLLPIDHAVGRRGAISVTASTPDKAAPISSCFGSTIFVAMSDDVGGCPETAAASGWFDGRAREVGERVLAAEIRRGGHGLAVIGSAYSRGVGPTQSSTHPVNRCSAEARSGRRRRMPPTMVTAIGTYRAMNISAMKPTREM